MNKSILNETLYDLLKKYLPNDHSRQVTGDYYIQKIIDMDDPIILDLGCGLGKSFELFKQANKSVHWTGIDLVYSPEVNQRNRKDYNFVSFNGEKIPIKDSTHDLVFSKQVFEHVFRPEKLLLEINRVLKVNGLFIGSVSYLEPYHSLSVTNFTPYGLIRFLNETGFNLVELRPGIDGITLIIRSIIKGRFGSDFFLTHESPFNMLISLIYKLMNKSNLNTNFAKLAYAGHIVFLAKKQ